MTTRIFWGIVASVVVVFLATVVIGHETECHTEAVHAESGATNAEVCR